MDSRLTIGRKVLIPSSKLGQEFGEGIIVAKFGDTIQVNFSGALGQYTVSKHEIIIVD